MIIKGIKFEDANWTDDCWGKKDLDFPVLSVSTRYWPDFMASPSIYLGDKVIAELSEKEYIVGQNESDCKQKTEDWIKDQLIIIINKITN